MTTPARASSSAAVTLRSSLGTTATAADVEKLTKKMLLKLDKHQMKKAAEEERKRKAEEEELREEAKLERQREEMKLEFERETAAKEKKEADLKSELQRQMDAKAAQLEAERVAA